VTLPIEDLEGIVGQVQNRIYLANQCDELETLLQGWGLGDLLSATDSYEAENDPSGKIYVLGDTRVEVNVLRGVAADMGIAKARLVFLGFEKTQVTDCRKWQYNPDIAAIICGPLPHKCTGMGDYSGLIEALKNEPGYPPVFEVQQNAQGGELKITKNGFREVLVTALENGVVTTDF